MKIKMIRLFALRGLVISFAIVTFMFGVSTNVTAQKKCSKSGPPMRFEFRNATNKEIEVRLVLSNCRETPGRFIKPGEQVGGNSSVNNVFRVYEKGTNRFISEVTLVASKTIYMVRNCGVGGGAAAAITIENTTYKDVEIRKVRPDCREEAGKSLSHGEDLKLSSKVDDVYRVYEKDTNKLLKEIIIGKSKTYYKLENCSTNGRSRLMYIRNATADDIEVRRIDENCKEHSAATVAPGKQFESNTFANNVYRVYENGTKKFLDEFVIRPFVSTYIVNGVRHEVAAKGFLETVNNFRRANNLRLLVLDERLTDSCQWFAEFIAGEDQNRLGHSIREYRKDKPFPKRNSSKQRLVYFGWNKKKTTHFEVTAMDTIPDVNYLGSHFALLWSSGTSHYKPFFDKHRPKFRRVGFGYAKAKTGTIKYYACAIFANP